MSTEYSSSDRGVYRSIEVHPNDGALGAEVRCGDLRQLGDQEFAEIRKAWLEHLVLVFRGQTLTDPALLTLGPGSERSTIRIGRSRSASRDSITT